MLILVGVTINFALNRGIINKAKQASLETQKAADLEELQLAVISSINYTTGKVVRQDLVSNLSSRWNVSSSAPYTCTSPSSNIFTVTEDGLITEEGEDADEDLAFLRTLIGSTIGDLIDAEASQVAEAPVFKYGITMSTDYETGSLEEEDDHLILIFSYKNNLYSFYFTFDDNMQSEMDLELANVTKGVDPKISPTSTDSSSTSDDSSTEEIAQPQIGDYVTYNNIGYIIMAEDTTNGTVDLISANAFGSKYNATSLGYNDPAAIVAVPAVNENSLSDGEKGERARWSYNNMVNTLVTACKDATGLTIDGTNVISVRCVGNTNVKYTSSGITGTDNPGLYSYDYQTTGASYDWFTADQFDRYNLKDDDNNYETDWNTMKYLGIISTDDRKEYWLASRYIRDINTYIDFSVRTVESGELNYNSLYEVSDAGNSHFRDRNFSIRPIITINSTLLENVTGSGTSYDPFVIQ